MSLAVALGLGVTGRARAVHQPGVDIQVNNSATDTPENTTQSETSLAVSGNTICAGFNDSGPTAGFSGFARSTNLGDTWADQGELGAGNNGDPVLAVNQATGTFYYGENATIGGNPAIGVARSTDDCVSFGTQVDASAASSVLQAAGNRTTLSDKPWLAVDNTGGANNGNIYVCWTRFIDTSIPSDGIADTSELRFSRSTDGGATYVSEQVLQAQGPAPFGCSVEVGPGGQVYVTWADRVTSPGTTAGDIRLRASTDGGLTFGAPTQVSTGNRQPGTDRVVMCDVNRTTLNGNIRMLHQSWLAVDSTGGPFNGNLYAVWARDPLGATDNSDVLFSRSTDGGATWSAPVQLGAGGGLTDQFEPFVAVAGAGAVSVAWYDRRNDAANNLNIDVYKAFSSNGGVTFGPIARVTAQSFGVPQLNPNFDPAVARCYMGEYIGVAGDAQNFYYLWGDNRNTVTSTNWPAGRPDPDVWFESEAAPVVNNADLAITKSDNPDPVVAGRQLVYTITVQNLGPHIALDVVVTDTLPPEVTYVSDTGSCDTSALPTLTCSLGDMPAGSTRSFTITVMVKYNAVNPTTITNTASVDGVANDPNQANNSDSESTLIVLPQHFESYDLAQPERVGETVVLVDQFGTRTVRLEEIEWLMNPVEKRRAGREPVPITRPDEHLTCHGLPVVSVTERTVHVRNQFVGDSTLRVGRPLALCAPAAKTLTGTPGDPPSDVQHYECYDVRGETPLFRSETLGLRDQFGTLTARIDRARELCNPVEKRRAGRPPEPILRPDDHLVCYRIVSHTPAFAARTVFTHDQFRFDTLRVVSPRRLCVPSEKTL